MLKVTEKYPLVFVQSRRALVHIVEVEAPVLRAVCGVAPRSPKFRAASNADGSMTYTLRRRERVGHNVVVGPSSFTFREMARALGRTTPGYHFCAKCIAGSRA